MKAWWWVFGMLVFLLPLGIPPADAQTVGKESSGWARKCRTLIGDHADILDAPTHIITASFVQAGVLEPDLCKAEGYIQPNIGIEIRLPTNWNGKFVEVGCGGYCGFIAIQNCATYLQDGYACIAGDMGHKSTGLDALWAYNNLQAEFDFGLRSTHVTGLAGKALATEYYGEAPQHSYFIGASTGGRQGLLLAQRFPYDFDGIVSMVGPIDETADGMTLMWNVLALVDEHGAPLVSKKDLELVHAAVLERCDMDDNLRDGLISNPPDCRFQPADLVCDQRRTRDCLSKAAAEAVRKIYQGPVNSEGKRLYHGVMPGSELSWYQSYVVDEGGGRYWDMAQEMFRYMAFLPDPGPSWTLRDFNWDRDFKRLASMEALYNAANPDIRKFRDSGGKLIIVNGWADQAVMPAKLIDYYLMVERIMGGLDATKTFARMFMIPGQHHGLPYGGAGTLDYLSYLADWVERSKPPDRMIGAHVRDPATSRFPIEKAQIVYTRPIYPFPLMARYSGSGDPNDAASFVPVPLPQFSTKNGTTSVP